MEGVNESKYNKFNHKAFLVGFFILVIGVIAFTAFSGDGILTGNILSSSENVSHEGIDFKANLSGEEMNVEGEFDKIVVSGKSSGSLKTGDTEIDFSELESVNLVLENYEGKIGFDSGKINSMSGEAEKVSINGLSYNGLEIKSFDDFYYDSLEIKKGVSLKEIKGSSSGEISFNEWGGSFDLDNQSVVINEYYGNLNSSDGRYFYEGVAEGLDIKGEYEISITY